MIRNLLRYWVTFFVPVFYKRIGIKNKERLLVDGPVIVAMNHPNAFTDPIIITYLTFPQRLRYLARGDAFKPGFVSMVLEQIGIVPIFRLQDGGKEGLMKNEETYRRVYHLLKRNAKLIIFAEGLCIQERRLRPLKKGVARMAFGAYENIKNDKLVVLPVGVNYSMPHQFRSDIFYQVGEPILVKDYITDYQNNPAKTANTFLKDLEDQLKPLVTHINDKNNDQAVLWIEEMCKKDWIKAEKLNPNNLEHDFIITEKITSLVNTAAIDKQDTLAKFKVEASKYFDILKKNKVLDCLINPNQNKYSGTMFFLIRIVLLLLTLPLYLIALVGNFAPLFLTDYFTKKIIKFIEFYSSIAIALGMVIFLINYLLVYFVAHAFTHNALSSLSICVLLVLAGWFALYYHPFMKKTLAMGRLSMHKEKFAALKKQRENLITLINNLKAKV
ncbi:MAG: 1-acyl-sn-glycerol-3-phosphate acyltransferase [Bacteroidota bacterium]